MRDRISCTSCGRTMPADAALCGRCGLRTAARRVDAKPPLRAGRILLGVGTATAVGLAGAIACHRPPVSALAPTSSVSITSKPAPASATPIVGTVSAAASVAFDVSQAGEAAYGRADVQGSVEAFEQAVEAEPGNARALNNLGQALVRGGRAAEAIPYFDQAIAASPGTWAYQFNRARGYAELKQWGQAVAGYREALRLFPDDYATHFNLARALQAAGDLPAAIAGFERAIELAPGQFDFHLVYGLALESAERPGDAAMAYRRYVALAPASPDVDKVKARISLLEGTRPGAAGTSVEQ